MKKNLKLLIIFLGILAIISTGCGSAETTTNPVSKGPIVVGSKIDTEGNLLGQMIILLLRDNDFNVIDNTGTGSTSVVRAAITSGEIDIYPEYTGNGAFFFDETDSQVWHDASEGYLRVKELDKAQNNIEWLKPAPANNTWAIAVTQELAAANNLESLEDLSKYLNAGGYFKLAGSAEFFDSPVALPAFEEAYGFNLSFEQTIVVGSGNTAQTEEAAYRGTDGVNAAMAYGTDGNLDAFNLVVLTDPRNVQPVYEPAPIIRSVVLSQYPEISQILDPVFETLNLETLQELNRRIVVNGEAASFVAEDYLQANGFLN